MLCMVTVVVESRYSILIESRNLKMSFSCLWITIAIMVTIGPSKSVLFMER